MKGQALAIALVIASGIGTYVMSLSVLDSLQRTQVGFYRASNFPHVFAGLKRAPESLRARIREIPGVQFFETRVKAQVNMDIEGYSSPASALLVSLDERRGQVLNKLHLLEGRLADPFRDDEVVANDAFVEAQGLALGDRLGVIINGRKQRLTVVGTATTPEYLFPIKPGALFPDFESYAILWMGREGLATAYDMDGAFNDVAITVTPGTNPQSVIDRLDDLLARYGGLGAFARKNQPSHKYISEEMRQLEAMSTIYPIIFLSVAAFLLNVVFNRQIQMQREEIATLKAFGYSRLAIAVHYAKLVVMVGLVGVLLGLLLGVVLGSGMSEMYRTFYRFPYIEYRLDPRIVVWAVLVAVSASLAGALFAVRKAALQPPAEAMRPEPPARYRVTLVERLGLRRWLSQPARMIARNLERRPLKALMTTVGISFSCAILIMAMFFQDAVDHTVRVQFQLAQRQDLQVTFTNPTSYKAAYELARMPGVEYVEGYRAIPVRLRAGHRTYLTGIQGVREQRELRRLLDADLQEIDIPADGLVLTDYLGTLLDLEVGDEVVVEVLEGGRPIRRVSVVGFATEFAGVSGYMSFAALHRFLREGPALSGLFVSAEDEQRTEIYSRIKEMPRVAATGLRQKAIDSLMETMAEQMLAFGFVATILAGTIAFGVVYNSARITLSERNRELASLRVLGLTRGEVSYILLGELALLTLLAIPVGCLIGYVLTYGFVSAFQTDLFRIPMVLQPRTYTYAASVVIVAAIISGAIVQRKINTLDMVEVLKTRE